MYSYLIKYQISKFKSKSNNILGWVCLFISISIYSLLRFNNIDDTINLIVWEMLGGKELVNSKLGFSKYFTSDYIVCFLVYIMFIGSYQLRFLFKSILQNISGIIRFFSKYTFSLYLFHFPLLYFYSFFYEENHVILLLTVLSVFVIGYYTEQKKNLYKGFIYKYINIVFNTFGNDIKKADL